MDIVQVGIDHHLAPLEVREHLALTHEEANELATTILAEPWAEGALVLATCNRTEVYAVSPSPRAEELVLETLLQKLPAAPPPSTDCYRVQRGVAVARYLLRVASGLQSAILGETEIQGQVRGAHERGKATRTLGPVLDRLCMAAIHTGKRVRSETGISAGGISHGGAAVQVVGRVFDSMKRRRILVVGAGTIGSQAARALSSFDGAELVVANRTEANARTLVDAIGRGEVAGLDDLEAQVRAAHVVVFATGVQTLSHEALASAIQRRRDPLLVVDLGLPRSVDERARQLPGVFLYDLEDLERLVADALSHRREAVPAVEAIVHEELERFRGWFRKHGTAPAIRTLHAWAEGIRAQEAEYAGKDLPEEVQQRLDRLSRRLVNRLLGRPASRVARGAEKADPNLPTVEHLRHVFGFDDCEDS